jgi:DNA repair exonuclease SbcCD nuclease subunit
MMERVIKTPYLILTGDWHLREDTPVCFTGDFQLEQWNCVRFVNRLQEKYKCPVIHAGDLFHHWKPSPWLLSMVITNLPDKFYTLLGQHDIPQHNLELVHKCGVYTLELAGKLTILNGTHFEQEPIEIAHSTLPLDILVWHHLTYLTPPYPGATGGNAESILKKYSQFRLIVTGDNHCSFTIEKNGRRLVNTGNLTRQTADQIDFKPCVWLWYNDNSVQQVFLPIEEGVVSREHLVVKQERDSRIDAFISKLNDKYEVSLSFENNLEQFFKTNDISKEVKQIIYTNLE